jgi:ribokinase
MVGSLGDDDFGARLRGSLEDAGVNVDHVRVDREAGTGVALILVEEDGENRIVVVSGANARLSEEDVGVAARLLGATDAVLMQLEVPIEVVGAVAAEARSRQVLSVLDAGAATPAASEAGLPSLVDVISPNETEAEALTGIPVRDVVDARHAAERLRDMGAREVVLKLGEDGAYWLGPDGEGHLPAFAVDSVDTTAAGDAFTACLAVGLARGLDRREAIRLANAAGALACLELGAQPSMPTADSVADFLAARDG